MRRYQARLWIFAVGLLSVAWSIGILWMAQGKGQSTALDVGRQQDAAPISSAIELQAREPRETFEKWVRASTLESLAMRDLHALEVSYKASDIQHLDALFATADRSILRSLANSPANGLLWAAYFWLRNNTHGFSDRNVAFLRMSYETGPNEGRIATVRSGFAMALFSTLPPDIGAAVVAEFRGMVRSQYYSLAVDLLSRQNSALAARLIASLADLDLEARLNVARLGYRKGLDTSVLGIQPPDWRPWH